MAYYLCDYHNEDGDLRGWQMPEPEITCQACRAEGFFTEEQIEEYKAASFERYAVYRRQIGFPDQIYAILKENDSLFEAERIAPRSEFRFLGIEHNDPYAYANNNTLVLEKPTDGRTLEDIRGTWDHAPWYRRPSEDPPRTPQAYVLEVTPAILQGLSIDYEEIYRLKPGDFELLVQDRLEAMGFGTQRVQGIYSRDGGIDIVFWPKPPFSMPFLAAAQIKHHRTPKRRTGPAPLRELAGVIGQDIRFGLVVTNTTFTPDARWLAEQKRGLIRLRDMADLRRWIAGQFAHDAEWREIPRKLQLCPGVEIDLTVGKAILPENL